MKKLLIFCCLAIAFNVNAKGTGGLKSGKAYTKVLRATVQRTMPGRNTGVRSDYDIILTWNNNTPPESFFWRGENGWLPCDVQKMHRANKKANNYAPYNTANGKIHKGDILELKPVVGGKFAMPQQIPDTTVNTLFFKTANSDWFYYKVKLSQKPDIILP